MTEEIELMCLFYMDISYFLIPFLVIFLLLTKISRVDDNISLVSSEIYVEKSLFLSFL